MSIPSKQIGWSNESNLLWYICKQLERLTSVTGSNILGTGTVDYLPKWTSSGVIGDSQVYDDGTNVGIGTSTPAYKLDVNGVIKSANGLYVGPVNYAPASINISSFTTKGNFANSVMTLSSTEAGPPITVAYPTQLVFAQEGATVGWTIQSVNQGVSYTPLILNKNGGSVLIGTSVDSGCAALEVKSTTKGFLPPVMSGSQAEAISTPTAGLMVYANNGNGAVITSTGWWGYNGSTWVKLN